MKLLKKTPDYYHYINKLNKSFVDMMIEDNKFESENINLDDIDIKVGLEFEFYLGDESEEFKTFRNSLQNLFQVALPVVVENIIFLPDSCDKQKNKDYWYLERDDSLNGKNGYELVSPMLDLKSLNHYMTMITSFIEKLGYTQNDCGFHVHISSEKLGSITPSTMMLLLSENDCLSKWEERAGYNKNILEYFKIVHPDIFDTEYQNLSKRYNLISRFNEDDDYKNHLEIRAFGGKDYHLKCNEILDDLKKFIEKVYIKSTEPIVSDVVTQLKKAHIKKYEESFSKPITFNELKEKINFKPLDTNNEESQLIELILELEKERKFVPTCTIYNDYYSFCKEDLNNSISLINEHQGNNTILDIN